MNDLSGKIAVVTGANSGMGYATAAALSDAGAHVIMLCRDKERGQDALLKLKEVPHRSLDLIFATLETIPQSMRLQRK